MECVTVYTDGSYKPQTGVGGWGAVVIDNGRTGELFGSSIDTSVIRMEMTAIVFALEHFTEPKKILLYTDSYDIVLAMTDLICRWKSNGWVNGRAQSITNRDLWNALDFLCDDYHQVVWNWVRGHAGNKYNERADRLANYARRCAERKSHSKHR